MYTIGDIISWDYNRDIADDDYCHNDYNEERSSIFTHGREEDGGIIYDTRYCFSDPLEICKRYMIRIFLRVRPCLGGGGGNIII